MQDARDGEQGKPDTGSGSASQRLDKWLWFARIVKSRTLAADVITQGRVRINRARVMKASQAVRAGDVLTIALRGRVQVLKVVAEGTRRGPPPEARRLYEELTAPAPAPGAENSAAAQRLAGAGRPTKRDRRRIDRLTEEE
jgi:ribosome-associated heat shock protein Hsp15